jgi:hypothetical protein
VLFRMGLFPWCFEYGFQKIRDLEGQVGGDCITDLFVLFSPRAAKEIIVWKGLKTCGLPDRQASCLFRVRVNVIVSVLRDMGGDCS